MKRPDRLLFVTLLLVTLGVPAYGYVDPGTGSFVFQALIAGAVGAIFAVKTFWGNIKATLVRKPKAVEQTDASEA